MASLLLAASACNEENQDCQAWIAFCAKATVPDRFTFLGQSSIFVIDPDGGRPREILPNFYCAYDPFRIEWLRRLNILVTSVDVPRETRIGLGAFPRIWVVDCRRDDSAKALGSSTADFAVSPEGDRVAWVGYENGHPELHVRSLQGTGAELVTADSWKVWEPCWSPDGRFVVHRARLRAEDDHVDGSEGLYRLDVATGRRERVAPDFSFPQFLAGGESLLVMDQLWPAEPKTLRRLDAASGQTTVVAAGLAPVRPAVSADGCRIACILADGDTLEDSDRIGLVGLDGSEPEEIARGRSPTWSPDGSRLAYERDGFIYVLDLSTRAETKLVQGVSPSWSR